MEKERKKERKEEKGKTKIGEKRWRG